MSEIIPRVIVKYEELFDDFNSVNLNEILSQIPTMKVIQIASHTINYLNHRENFNQKQINIVNGFIKSIPNYVHLFDKLNNLSKSSNSLVLIFTNINCLFIMQKSLHLNIPLDTDKINSQDRERFLKAILLINQVIVDKKQKSLDINEKLSSEELYIRNILPMYIPDMEFQYTKDLVVQSTKLKYFIDFINSNDEFKKYEHEFLSTKKVNIWDEYIKYLWLIYASLHKSGSKLLVNQQSNKILFDINKEINEVNFFNTLAINSEDIEISDINISEAQEFDFKLLRKFPLYKFRENLFGAMNINFLADKMFQGIQYDYCDIVERRGKKSYARGFKDYYSDHFAHRSLFHPIIDYCINIKDNDSIKVNGEKYPQIEYSDFYIRNRKKIFLIEFKDYVMNAKTKHSQDYDLIINYIEENFITPKGANQLVNVINKLSNGGFPFDSLAAINKYNLDEIIIQPIIVYTDASFSCPCINYIVNKGFRELLKKYNHNYKIEDLVMIHFDLFVKYQDSFNKNILKLNDIIMKYIRYINKLEKANYKLEKINPEVYTDFESFFSDRILISNKQIILENPLVFKELTKRILPEKN